MLSTDVAVADAFACYMKEEGFEIEQFTGAYQSEFWWKIVFRSKHCLICDRKHENQNNYWKQFKEGKPLKNLETGEKERDYPSAYICCYQSDWTRSVRRPWFPATEDLYIMHERGYLLRWRPFFYATNLSVPKKRRVVFELEEESSEDSLESLELLCEKLSEKGELAAISRDSVVEEILAEESPLKN